MFNSLKNNFSKSALLQKALLENSKNSITLFVNNKKYVIENPDPEAYLIDFLRENDLKGTKFGCGEGGCGACTVMISSWDKENKKANHLSVNSCLAPLCALDGISVTTIEGLGNIKSIHPIQKVLAENHGSQCGFCTPGIIMSIYSSLLNWSEKPNKTELTVNDIEKNLGGNLCRCTGYRPILQTVIDITKNPKQFQKFLEFPEELKNYQISTVEIEKKDKKWFTPTSLKEISEIKKRYGENCRIVIGNSELGIDERFKHINFGVYINGSHVKELREFKEKVENGVEGLLIGPSITITEIQENFEKIIEEKKKKGEEYKTRGLKSAIEMIERFASTPVRNTAGVAGNLVTASPTSDLNPVWSSLNAKLILLNTENNEKREVLVRDFFKKYRVVDLKPKEIILGLFVPFCEKNEYVKAFKQARRREDDIAIVNNCCRIKVGKKNENTFKIEDIALSFGGMSFKTICATKTENFLKGKEISIEKVKDGKKFQFEELFEEIVEVLTSEIKLPENVPGGQPYFRTALSISFFYKFYMHVLKEIFGNELKKENNNEFVKEIIEQNKNFEKEENFEKNFSFAIEYEHSEKDQIIGEPNIHINSKIQTTGEAKYIDDLPKYADELEGALVISTVPKGKIKKIDTSEALKLEGVVAYISSKDIPEGGSNNFHLIVKDEYAFHDKEVTSVGQTIGVIVAKTREQAKKAAALVKVEYEEEDSIITIDEAIEKKSFIGDDHKIVSGNVDEEMKKCENDPENYIIVEGNCYTGGQEHFYLEPQSAIAVPQEPDELIIYSSTQNPTENQVVVSDILGVPYHKVVVKTKRLGGGFGGKESRAALITIPASIAAKKLGKPVRIVLERDIDIMISGQRHSFLGKYKAAARKSDGKIMAYDVTLYNNAGYSLDLSQSILDRGLFHIDAAYNIPNLKVSGYCCKTNSVSNTAYRGFGGPQGMIVTESMLEKVSEKINIPLEKIRENNFYKEGDKTHYGQEIVNSTIKTVWEKLKKDSEFEKRKEEIEIFNSQNTLKKRGISMVPVKFGIAFTAHLLNQGGALVHIYKDGSVMVSHGGTEMGQGLFTKVAQTVASALQIPLSKVFVSETATDKVPNTSPTAASSGSDINCAAAQNACDKINERLKNYREDLKDSDLSKWEKWKKIVTSAYCDRVSLSATGFFKMPNIYFDWNTGVGHQFAYFTVGAACSEVEIDVLTGDHRVIRSDIVMDLGSSINPGIDIGQVEGAFVQGMGYFTIEELIKGDKNHPWVKKGHHFTKGPGFYKIPSFDDVPLTFNVQLLKNTPNPFAIHRSKAVGEPPFFMGASVLFALKNAIKSSRKQNNLKNYSLVDINYPITSERIRLHTGDKISKYLLGEDLIESGNDFVGGSY